MKKLNLIINSCDECPYHHIGYYECFHKLSNDNSIFEKDCPLEDVTIFDNVLIEGMRGLTKEESEAYNKFLNTQFEIQNNGIIEIDQYKIGEQITQEYFDKYYNQLDPICNP
jgi:hypothetical protein